MKIIYVDMDDVLCDFVKAYNQYKIDYPYVKYPQSTPKFFFNLEPIKGAIQGVEALKKYYDIYILTAPSVKNPGCYTDKRLWIEEHLGYDMAEKLIISPNKGLNKGDYLIDDYSEGKGQEHFEGELIQFASSKFPDWDSVLNYLID